MEMRVGQIKRIDYVCKERLCFECNEPAQYKHTFLLEGGRANPNSSAYRKDDCSWCEDECNYACEEHKELMRENPPIDGIRWCSTFYRSRFPHMFLYWEKESEEIINDGLKEVCDANRIKN